MDQISSDYHKPATIRYVDLDYLNRISLPATPVKELSLSIEEKCGIAGVVINRDYSKNLNRSDNFATRLVYEFMLRLQHRGKHSAGFAFQNKEGTVVHKVWSGAVDNFSPQLFTKSEFNSFIASGHNRYSTTGSAINDCNAQPLMGTVFLNDRKLNFCLSHNGNITNHSEIKAWLRTHGKKTEGNSDTSLVVCLIEFISEQRKFDKAEDLIRTCLMALKGSYSFIFQFPDSLIAARDPHGNRPFHFATDRKGSYFLFSETCAVENIRLDGFDSGLLFFSEIYPGEIISFRAGQSPVVYEHTRNLPARTSSCTLEDVYMQRATSTVSGSALRKSRFFKLSGHKMYRLKDLKTFAELRVKIGEALAKEYSRLFAESYAVVAIPNSGIPYAKGIAKQIKIINLPLIVNTHIDRSFQAASEEERDTIAKSKYLLSENVIKSLTGNNSNLLRGKTLIFVDDSSIRGTTLDALQPIFGILKSKYGVKKIIFALAYPPVEHACPYGVAIKPDGKFFVKEVLPQILADPLYMKTKYAIDSMVYIGKQVLATVKSDFIAGRSAKNIKIGNQNRGNCFGCVDSNFNPDLFDNSARGLVAMEQELKEYK